MRSPLLHFVLLGGLLFVLQSAWSNVPPTPQIEVRRSEIAERIELYRSQTGRAPTDVETQSIENQVVENAIWLEQAFALGLHEIDSVVRQRLILNMRFLEGETEESDEELIKRAIALGMDRSDTVVQRRLIDRVQAIIRAGVRAQTIEEATLLDHFESTQERWRDPALLDLTHVYLSRDKRGEATRANALELLEQLSEGPIEPTAGIALGDPFLSGHRLRGATPNRIVARLGPVFEEGVADAPTGAWFGPIESAFGQHVVWIHERVDSRIPALDEIRQRVEEDWIEQESRAALKKYVEQRKLVVQIEIIDDLAPDRAKSENS